ncbi:MAG TPA: hypothetical protein VJB61_14720 [Actinomycetota bacterium]
MTIAVVAVGLAGWALGTRDPYGDPAADPAPAVTTPAPAPQGQAAPDPTTPQVTTRPAPPRPRIVGFGSEPVLPTDGGFWKLPAGAGILTLVTDAPNATKVEFLLTPTGTEVADLAVRIGQDTNGRDGWLVNWHYDDKPIMAHLTVRATGPGGTAEESVGIYRPDPTLEP